MDTIEDICPDFPEWPQRWMGVEEDRAYGQGLLDAMRPFLGHLIAKGLKKKTIRNHLDSLWLLGGEIIREVSTFDGYAVPPVQKLRESVGPDGGPYCGQLDSEQEVSAFDSTCRQLHAFLENGEIGVANQEVHRTANLRGVGKR